jgi:lipopolysaccharide exporter
VAPDGNVGVATSKSPTLGRQTSRAAVWSGLSSIVLRVGSLLVGIVAARLIAPEQFGVFAVALTVHAIIINASDLGVSAYIVRFPGDLGRVAPTVTALAIMSSTVLAAAMIFAAPLVATALGAPTATGAVRVMSLTVVVSGVVAVPGALLVREFKQDKRFYSEVAGFVVSTGLLVVLALDGGGSMALAWSRLGGHLVAAVLTVVFAGRYFRLSLDLDVVPNVLRFGVPLIGASFVGFAVGNVDYIVIGRALGPEPLGLYFLAYNVGSWPYALLTAVVAGTAMPAFLRLRRKPNQLPAFISSTVVLLSLLAAPSSALIVALSGPLVESLYGQRWAPAATTLAATALYGALRVPADLFTNVIIAAGRTRALLVINLIYLVTLLALLVVGVTRWGILGAGVAHVVAIAVILLPGLLVVLRSEGLVRSPGSYVPVLVPILTASIAASVAWVAAGLFDSSLAGLVVGAFLGMATYALLTLRWSLRVWRRTRTLWDEHEAEQISAQLPLSA